MEENQEPTTSNDDVEAHGTFEKPGYEKPGYEANSESDDVEAHGTFEKPGYEKPGDSESDSEAIAVTVQRCHVREARLREARVRIAGGNPF